MLNNICRLKENIEHKKLLKCYTLICFQIISLTPSFILQWQLVQYQWAPNQINYYSKVQLRWEMRKCRTQKTGSNIILEYNPWHLLSIIQSKHVLWEADGKPELEAQRANWEEAS